MYVHYAAFYAAPYFIISIICIIFIIFFLHICKKSSIFAANLKFNLKNT